MRRRQSALGFIHSFIHSFKDDPRSLLWKRYSRWEPCKRGRLKKSNASREDAIGLVTGIHARVAKRTLKCSGAFGECGNFARRYGNERPANDWRLGESLFCHKTLSTVKYCFAKFGLLFAWSSEDRPCRLLRQRYCIMNVR
jgi:hypothetical protein